MNQPVNLNNVSKVLPKQAFQVTGAITLTIFLISLVGYMMKTGEVNFITGGLVVLTGIFSGFAWGNVLGNDAEM